MYTSYLYRMRHAHRLHNAMPYVRCEMTNIKHREIWTQSKTNNRKTYNIMMAWLIVCCMCSAYPCDSSLNGYGKKHSGIQFWVCSMFLDQTPVSTILLSASHTLAVALEGGTSTLVSQAALDIIWSSDYTCTTFQGMSMSLLQCNELLLVGGTELAELRLVLRLQLLHLKRKEKEGRNSFTQYTYISLVHTIIHIVLIVLEALSWILGRHLLSCGGVWGGWAMEWPNWKCT